MRQKRKESKKVIAKIMLHSLYGKFGCRLPPSNFLMHRMTVVN